MLKKCAPGHEWIEKDHYFQVYYRGKAFLNLPKGSHRGKEQIQRPWAKKLASQLDIVECAKREIPAL